jgi:hypothetical protein
MVKTVRSIAAAAVLAAGVTALAPAATAAPPPPPPPKSTDLHAALLTVDDFPDGFVKTGDSSSGNVSIGASFTACPPLRTSLTNGRTRAAAVSFSMGTAGPNITNAVIRFPKGTAAPALTRLASVATQCKSFSQTLAGLPMRFTVTAQPVPKMGDQAVGLRLVGTTTSDGITVSVTADIAAARHGDVMVWLHSMSMGTDVVEGLGDLLLVSYTRCTQHLVNC